MPGRKARSRTARCRDCVSKTLLLYRLYEQRLEAGLPPEQLPGHVGVLVDGNRRWAEQSGGSTADGHRAGADDEQFGGHDREHHIDDDDGEHDEEVERVGDVRSGQIHTVNVPSGP